MIITAIFNRLNNILITPYLVKHKSSKWIVAALVLFIVEVFVIVVITGNIGFTCSQITFESFIYAILTILWFYN